VAALLIESFSRVTAVDTRPALLVPVAVSALYGGLGPGFLAVLLVGLLSQDPGVLLAAAALAAICAPFRRARAQPAAAPESSAAAPPSAPPAIRPQPLAPASSEVTTPATWRFQHQKPLDITLPEAEQIEHLYLYAVLAECNDAFARMYGFRVASEVIGTRLVVFCPPSHGENVTLLEAFIRSGYRLEDAESHEIDRYGNPKYFLNNLVGILERGQLVGAWGTQRDITDQKRGLESQEYRSRIHSVKSSSQ
jgi:hypothetical protein